MWFALAAGCDLLDKEATVVDPEAYCEEAIPSINVTADNACAPIWVCCEGDPSEAVQCWYQSGDPEHEVSVGLVFRCGGSLAACDDAEDDASYWACFEADA